MANLEFTGTLDKIKSGKIATSQIGNAPLWVLTRHYRGIKRGQVLVPNVTAGFFFVLKEAYSLLRQQGHIMDGYEGNEVPRCGLVFESLVRIVQKLGMQGKLTDQNRRIIALELNEAADGIRGTVGGKAAAKALLLEAIEECIARVNQRRIRDRVENAIRYLVGRMEQIGTGIGPLIERRRVAAFYAIAQEERQLWRIAYTLQIRAKTTAAENVTVALAKDLEAMRIPEPQPFRAQVMKARTLVRNAIAAIESNNSRYASHLLSKAIEHLGFEPETLERKPRIEKKES